MKKIWIQMYWRVLPGTAVLAYVSHGAKISIVKNISKRLEELLIRKGYTS